MSCPDPLRPYNPFEDVPSPHKDFDVHGQLPSDAEIRGLTSTLAANGGGSASENLALDLVLNQIVEQACLATGATGAAIALTRDGEMVCRATTGRTAPDLGVRLDNAGFSAECLRVGTLQRCDDTETDPRVDASACRLLGVRSILVVPLWYWGEFMGIFEIFSPRPNAFGERDEQTLQALAYRIVRHTKESSGRLAGFTAAEQEVPAFTQREVPAFAAPPEERRPERAPEPVPEPPRPNVVELKPKIVISQPPDRWTDFLMTCAGFIAVVIVGLMVWRLQWNRAAAAEKSARSTAAGPQIQELDLGPPAAVAAPLPEEEAPKPVAPAPKPKKSVSADEVVVSAVEKKPVAAPPPSEVGLAIYDKDGKLIYGTPIADPNEPTPAPTKKAAPKPASSSAKSASQLTTPAALVSKSGPADASTPDLIDGRFVRLKPELAEGLLADRVEPEYPDAARRAHIQGSVTLETLIGANGRVQQVTPVSGNPQLADAAVNAVRQWRYKPFTVDGHKVPIRTQVTVQFMLAQ
jgi:TonB family protein